MKDYDMVQGGTVVFLFFSLYEWNKSWFTLPSLRWPHPSWIEWWQRQPHALAHSIDSPKDFATWKVCCPFSKLLAVTHLQPNSLRQFKLAACTVDPQTDAYDPSPLKEYLAKLGVPYFFESQPIIDAARDSCATSICSWCARMKRYLSTYLSSTNTYFIWWIGEFCKIVLGEKDTTC